MDPGERRRRTDCIIARRIRTWRATAHSLYVRPPRDRNFSVRLYSVRVGNQIRWTFHEWLAKPGLARKHNGAHGRCSLCDYQPNPKREGPSLSGELDQLNDLEPAGQCSAKHRRRKDTKRWCRGKVGVPHVSRWQALRPGSNLQILICQSCRKQLDWCSHFPWWPKKTECRCPLGREPPARPPLARRPQGADRFKH